jgi:hypothetical protein
VKCATTVIFRSFIAAKQTIKPNIKEIGLFLKSQTFLTVTLVLSKAFDQPPQQNNTLVNCEIFSEARA